MARGSLSALLLAPLALGARSGTPAAAGSSSSPGTFQEPSTQEPSTQAVNAAIERGVGFLLRSQNRDGSWGVDLYERGTVWHDLRDGATALATYTLLKCGFAPDHPAIRQGATFLVEQMPHHTYATGIQLHALGAIDAVAHEKRMKELVKVLADLEQNGGWDYPGIGRPDLSNTQVAALGFRAAVHAGLDVPKSIWSDLVEIALRYQERPVQLDDDDLPKEKRRMAGFFYEHGVGPSASMTTAGLTILGIALEDPRRVDRRLEARIEEARQLALNWLENNFSVEGNPGGAGNWHYYYLYGLERVGAFFGLEQIGGHDWYHEGAAQLIRSQRPNGGWWNDGRSKWPPAPMPVANTCFALLFLRKATLSPNADRREHFASMEAESSDVWVRVDAKQTWTLWLSGFSPAVLERFPAPDPLDGDHDLRIERVEWWIDGERVALEEGDPGRPWADERFAIRWDPPHGGEFTLDCRVTLHGAPADADRAPDASVPASVELRSTPLSVRHELALEPWMLEYARDAGKNPFLEKELVITASSEESGFHPKGDVLDGLQGSAWWAAPDDPEPWIRLDLERGVRLKELWLSPAGASEVGREAVARVESVELRLNDSKSALIVPLDADERLKTKFVLPRATLVKSLELRVTDPPREGKCVGWAEIEGR